VLNQWLLNFAFRISIGVGLFVLAAAAVLVLTILTVSVQSIKTALANPVNSLKTE
jgi:putative ABC transport system permease protein